MKVLLDTDIGNDIDDAVCLTYLLAQPECELLGITTVTAGSLERARLASALCMHAGRQIPIRPGADRPLQREPLQEPPLSAEKLLARWPHHANFPQGEAVDFLRQTILAYPGEVTLVAIGPLTNIARLFRADPAVVKQLKSLVLMGGRYFTREDKPEWNIRNDPEAAQVVFASPLPHLRAVGLDVTRQVFLTAEEFRARFTGLLLDFSGPWLAERDRVTFHDPLAAATIFETFYGYQKGLVTIQPDGSTAFEPAVNGPHEVAKSVSPQRFFNHYFTVVH